MYRNLGTNEGARSNFHVIIYGVPRGSVLSYLHNVPQVLIDNVCEWHNSSYYKWL